VSVHNMRRRSANFTTVASGDRVTQKPDRAENGHFARSATAEGPTHREDFAKCI
jgi:hypothetical protein